jgi:guanine nucleotide-binding protein G(I)/G(S)/G(T) subunit beta-1
MYVLVVCSLVTMSNFTKQIEQNFKDIDALKSKLLELRDPENLQAVLSDGCTGVKDFTSNLKSCKILAGHFGKIYAMDWGADEKTVLSAAQDGSLILWDAMLAYKKDVINLRSSWVMTCAMSPNGSATVSGGLDNIATIYKMPEDGEGGTGDLKPYKQLLEHTGYLSGSVFLDDNKVITSSGDACAILWDIEAGTHISKFQGHTSDVMDVSLLADSNLFVSGSCDMVAKVWDHRDAKADVMTFPGHESDINAVDGSRNGNTFISAGDDSSIIMHDVRSYGPLQTYSSPTIISSITSVVFSASSRVIYGGYDDYHCYVWDTLTGNQIQSLDDHTNRVSCLGVNTTGNAMCTGGWDQILRVWA